MITTDFLMPRSSEPAHDLTGLSLEQLSNLDIVQPNVLGGAYGGTKAKPLAPCCRRLCLFEPLLFMTPPFPAALGLLIISQF